MRQILIIAAKELRDGLRNRWILATSILLAALSLSLAFLGSVPVGEVGASRLSITIVSLASLTIFLVPLIGLMLSYDTIIGDMERGTLLLILTYPVSHKQLILGKFLGHVTLIAIAIIIGYGAAAIAIFIVGEHIAIEEWLAYLSLLGTSIMLGAAFIAIGYVISVSVNEQTTAAGIAVGIWLLFILLYDMALLGVIVADQGESMRASIFNILLMANPADAFRIFNLTGFSINASLSGMTAVAGQAVLPVYISLISLAFWIFAPLSLANIIFSKKEI